jgi:hypothetical protein
MVVAAGDRGGALRVVNVEPTMPPVIASTDRPL